MALNWPVEPALGSLARLKLRVQWAPPSVVARIWPGPVDVPMMGSMRLLTDAKHVLMFGQLIPESSPVTGEASTVQVVPPLAVPTMVPFFPTAKHIATPGQLTWKSQDAVPEA